MNKILLINTSLKRGCAFVEPFLKRLEVYLSKSDCVIDVRDAYSFDERTFFEYDSVVFVFFTSLSMLPSTMLEVLNKLEGQANHASVYSLIVCDEYEPDKCDLSQKIIQQWSLKQGCIYKGTLKIASGLFIMQTASRFIVASHIQALAKSILNSESYCSSVTLLTMARFMRVANRYWSSEIKKKQKELAIKNKQK